MRTGLTRGYRMVTAFLNAIVLTYTYGAVFVIFYMDSARALVPGFIENCWHGHACLPTYMMVLDNGNAQSLLIIPSH